MMPEKRMILSDNPEIRRDQIANLFLIVRDLIRSGEITFLKAICMIGGSP